MSGSASDGSDSRSLFSQLFEPCTIVRGFGASEINVFVFLIFYPLPVRGETRRYIWREGVWVGMKQSAGNWNQNRKELYKDAHFWDWCT